MTSRAIARRRTHNQHVWSPLDIPSDVVASLGAMQSQEFRIALWSVAQRTGGVDENGMRRAFDNGTILRTHILRPTWHFVSAGDIRWLMALSGPRVDSLNMYRYRQLELDEKLLVKTTKRIAKSLSGGVHLTRRELGEDLRRARVSIDGQRLAYIVMRAELEGVICSGPLRGKQHTYALLDERAPKAKNMSRQESLEELARRYFTSHGPATLKDFSRWSSFTMSDCRSGLEAVQSELRREKSGDRTYWSNRSSRPPARRATTVDLVQIYDELVMGYSDSRDALRPPDISDPPSVSTPLMHAVLLDGQLIGHWKDIHTKEGVTVETSLFRSLKPVEEKALGHSVERYGRFIGTTARLVTAIRP